MDVLTPTEVALRIAAASAFKESATDADASKFTPIFPKLKGDGSLVKMGTRIAKGDKLYRSRVDLWDTEENAPENTPSLWEEIMYKDGIRIIPETITAENPFRPGDLGWWNGALYKSTLEGVNTYTPDQHPLGWELVKEAKK